MLDDDQPGSPVENSHHRHRTRSAPLKRRAGNLQGWFVGGWLVVNRHEVSFQPLSYERLLFKAEPWSLKAESIKTISIAPAGTVPLNFRRLLRVRSVTGSDELLSVYRLDQAFSTIGHLLGSDKMNSDTVPIPHEHEDSKTRRFGLPIILVGMLFFLAEFVVEHRAPQLIAAIVMASIAILLIRARVLSRRQ